MNRNPFPADPVATFGVPTLRTCDKLSTVRSAKGELTDYLTAYVKAETRYGAVVALAGAHGSGKTHLLLYLQETSRGFTSLNIGSVYIKPDIPGLFGVYRKALEAIGRTGIINLLDSARRELAKRDSDRTRITESISARIDQTKDLSELLDDNTVDADALENELDETLHTTGIPTDTIQALKLCQSSSGEKAFQWLLGNEVAELDTLGLSGQLRQTETSASGISAEDNVAIDGLSVLALLHRVAGSPFLVLIDQFDVLLPSEIEGIISYPAITTFMEAMKAQMSLVVIAGSEGAWSRLPPDVLPRVRGRAVLKVGALTRDEIVLLIDALMDSRATLNSDTLTALNELTGGNPREVLAISHQLYEKTAGAMHRATPRDVGESGLRSGTVDERAKLALKLTDEVIRDYGRISRDVATSDGKVIDRVVRQKERVVVAILLVRASDSVDETTQAKNLRDAIQSIRQTMPGAPVVAVTVGYTSAEVRSLFAPAATVIPFDDRTHKTQLEAEMVRLDTQVTTEPPKEDATKTAMVLDKITARLEALENARREEAGKAQERFAAEAANAAAPEIREREMKTRWQLLEELDRVFDYASGANERGERDSIRLILVNNEAHRNDRLLDELGGLYLDLLDIGRSAWNDKGMMLRLHNAKMGIIAEMRSRLQRRTAFNAALGRPVQMSLLIGTITLVLELLAATWFYLLREVPGAPLTYAFVLAVRYWLPFHIGGAFIVYGFVFTLLRWRNPAARWRRRIAWIRKDVLERTGAWQSAAGT